MVIIPVNFTLIQILEVNIMREESQHHIMEEEKGLAFYFIFTLGPTKANSL